MKGLYQSLLIICTLLCSSSYAKDRNLSTLQASDTITNYTLRDQDVNLDTNGYITSCTYDFTLNDSKGTNLTRPDTLDGVLVRGIVDGLCNGDLFCDKNLRSIILPDSIVYIGNKAFTCNKIETLSEGIIRRWRREFDGPKEAFTGKGNIALTPEQRERATLKAELIYRDKYHTFQQAYHAIYNYIENWYKI